jgi:hypothetical protein
VTAGVLCLRFSFRFMVRAVRSVFILIGLVFSMVTFAGMGARKFIAGLKFSRDSAQEGHTLAMAKSSLIPAGILLIASLAMVASFFRHPQEPLCEGRTLGVWLAGYRGGEPERQRADEVMLETGTNAIPTLLRMLRERDSAIAVRLVVLLRRQNLVKIHYTFAGERNAEAAQAFAVLGARAKDAVPELIKIYHQNFSESSRNYTCDSLGALGPAASEAVPTLMTGLTNPDWSVRRLCARTLGMIHSRPQAVVPALAKALRDPAGTVRTAAALGLGRFGAEAKPAVADLVRLLEDPEFSTRWWATNTLEMIRFQAVRQAIK